MELEWGSPGVYRCGCSGRRRASGGGAHLTGGAWARDCRCAGLDARVQAHPSPDVGHHVVDGTGADGAAVS